MALGVLLCGNLSYHETEFLIKSLQQNIVSLFVKSKLYCSLGLPRRNNDTSTHDFATILIVTKVCLFNILIPKTTGLF